MSKAFANPGALRKSAILALAALVGALVACRRNGAEQPAPALAPEVSQADAAAPDAAATLAAPDAAVVGAVALVDGGRACKLGSVTGTEGMQIMLFREAGDFATLLASADAGASQQQRTDQFRNGPPPR